MMMWRPLSLLLLILLFSIFFLHVSVNATAADHDHDHDHDHYSTRIELIHRHSPKLNPKPMSLLERFKDLLVNDIIRQNMISQRHQHQYMINNDNGTVARRQTWQTASLPLRAGKDYGTGHYFLEVRVGTPSQKMMMIMDTSSEMTWVNCHKDPTKNIPHRVPIPTPTNGIGMEERRVFKADGSSTFRKLTCSSPMCKIDLSTFFTLQYCPQPTSPCLFDYRYLDGSTVKGYYVNETVSMSLGNGKQSDINDMVIGCSTAFQGESFDKADGVLGLAYHKYSVANKASLRFGGKFSYCLMDHLSNKNVTNYLHFGNNHKATLAEKMRYTKLELAFLKPFYAVNVRGISINGVMLNIPSYVWNSARGGGTIVDSGTSLMFLTEPAYRPVMDALIKPLSRYQPARIEGVPMEYCFNTKGYDESVVPKLMIHFRDGARLQPPKKSYVVDVADGVKCIGFMRLPYPGINSIGSIMQQNHLWEFDLVNRKLGFAPSTCT